MNKLKKKAWSMFALYTKIKEADILGICVCCTCGQEVAFDSQLCQAGHFISGRNNAILFDELIVHPQCYNCNVNNKGEQGKYVLFMKAKYGFSDEQIEKMLFEKHPPVKIKDWQYEEMIKRYYNEIEHLLNTKFFDKKDIHERAKEKIKKINIKKILEG